MWADAALLEPKLDGDVHRAMRDEDVMFVNLPLNPGTEANSMTQKLR